jgi:MFS family permease
LFYLFTPGLLAQSLLFTGFMFHQIHLVEEKGWPLVVWGSLYLLYALSTIVMNLIVGALVDRFGAVRLAPFVTIPMGIGLLILSSSNSLVVAVIFMLCMSISSASQGTIAAPFFAERYGSKNLGAIKSLGTFMMVMMSAISPAILGWCIDRGVSMDSLAVGGAVYVALTSSMALLAYKMSLNR